MKNIDIKNVNVYGLEESIIASGYPMLTDTSEFDYKVRNLKYWIKKGLTDDVVKASDRKWENRLSKNDIIVEKDHIVVILRDNDGNETGRCLIDVDDYSKFANCKFSKSKSYVSVSYMGTQTHIHRLILNSDEVTDHIDGDGMNNRRYNLRACSNQDNTRNCKSASGVNFRKDRNKWRAYIMVNRKQISLGVYDRYEDALAARAAGEEKYFGEFKKGFNSKPEQTEYDLRVAIRDLKRIAKLGSSKQGSGHDCASKGIIVQADFTFAQYLWQQAKRYHWFDFVSSTSTMHRITKMDIKKACHRQVSMNTIGMLEDMVSMYNNLVKFNRDCLSDNEIELLNYYGVDFVKDKKDLFHAIICNIPSGFLLTARVTTNYLQLKTMYHQRKHHKLDDWREFCDWCENLPRFKELIGIDK